MSHRETKRRTLLLDPGRATFGTQQAFSYGNPTGSPTKLLVGTVTGRQVTTSEQNGWHKLKKSQLYANQPWDIGGTFETWRHEYESDNTGSITAYSDTRLGFHTLNRYIGPVRARSITSSIGDFPEVLPPTNLVADGTTAISRVLPTNPAADAATFSAELLREGLPSIVGVPLLGRDKGPIRNRVGSEYLNWEFGWAPIIAGLKDFAVVAKDYEKILEQYRRDSGRNVRRRYTFPDEVETTQTRSGTVSYPSPLNVQYFTKGGVLTTTVKKTRRRWFSGCFTYYLDPGDTAMGRARRHAQEAQKLLNLELTPAVVWNLAPWSWAIDWFTNVGDVFHNLSAFQQDGLVMRYGYIMETTIHEVTYNLSGLVWKNAAGPSSITETYRTVGKRRLRATPYGFGVDVDALTNRQLGIVAALGMTKSSNMRKG